MSQLTLGTDEGFSGLSIESRERDYHKILRNLIFDPEENVRIPPRDPTVPGVEPPWTSLY